MAKNKLHQILTLTDPPPNWRYEVGCYLHSFVAGFFITVGLVSPLVCFSLTVLAKSAFLIVLGLFLFSRLKIVQELIKILRAK